MCNPGEDGKYRRQGGDLKDRLRNSWNWNPSRRGDRERSRHNVCRDNGGAFFRKT